METWAWVAVLVLLSAGAGADYVWDGEQWQWQDVPAPAEDTEEGSGGGVVANGGHGWDIKIQLVQLTRHANALWAHCYSVVLPDEVGGILTSMFSFSTQSLWGKDSKQKCFTLGVFLILIDNGVLVSDCHVILVQLSRWWRWLWRLWRGRACVSRKWGRVQHSPYSRGINKCGKEKDNFEGFMHHESFPRTQMRRLTRMRLTLGSTTSQQQAHLRQCSRQRQAVQTQPRFLQHQQRSRTSSTRVGRPTSLHSQAFSQVVVVGINHTRLFWNFSVI